MRIYIAGRMTGIPESNYPAFHDAAKAWREAGWEVSNPAEHFGGDTTRTYLEYVEADIPELERCDAIAMLPGWDSGHSGAVWEYVIAKRLLGLLVYDAAQPIAPPDYHDSDARAGQLCIANYDEWRAFQRWRSGEEAAKQNCCIMPDSVASLLDNVLYPTPITRNEQGVLGRWAGPSTEY